MIFEIVGDFIWFVLDKESPAFGRAFLWNSSKGKFVILYATSILSEAKNLYLSPPQDTLSFRVERGN